MSQPPPNNDALSPCSDALMLLELTELTSLLMAKLHQADGSVDSEVRSIMEAYAQRHGERADRIALLRSLELRLEHEAAFISQEAERLIDRAERLYDLAAKARRRAVIHMQDHALETGELSMVVPGQRRCTLVTSPPQVVGPTSPSEWPEEFQMHVTEVVVNEEFALDLLLQGAEYEDLAVVAGGSELDWEWTGEVDWEW